jgi:UDP-glucose:(glucosyl)LPS alpha-1,2-glucosyltransferase
VSHLPAIAPTPSTPSTQPMGGTELILGHLRAALPELTDKVQIIMSRPLSVPLEHKPRLLWLQDRAQEPDSAPLRDAAFRAQFNALVFVSHWQQQTYHAVLGVPFAEGVVIKNAVPRIDVTLPKPRGDRLQFIYTSVPYKGLVCLTEAARRLAEIRQDWMLHVYSSLKIYGLHERDRRFHATYRALEQNPCVVFHGSVPNAEVRDAVTAAHVFVYPSTFMETSCMAAQEALMAGCLAITSNFGALPETCAEWAWMFPYDERPDVMVDRTVASMVRALDEYDGPAVQDLLPRQVSYYRQFYAFEARLAAWRTLLEDVARQPIPPALRA